MFVGMTRITLISFLNLQIPGFKKTEYLIVNKLGGNKLNARILALCFPPLPTHTSMHSAQENTHVFVCAYIRTHTHTYWRGENKEHKKEKIKKIR